MAESQDEDRRLLSAARQNARSILLARQRAELELLRTKEALRELAERLQLAMAAGRLGDWSWDARTDLVTLGTTAAQIFGLSAGPSITWTAMRELLHEDDRERARLAVERALATHGDYDIEYRVNRHPGEQCWIAARGHGTYTDDGKIVGMIGVVQDVTARKQAEEALHDETRVLELLNRTGAAIGSTLDLQKLVQTVTDAATEASNARFGAFFYNVIDRDGEAYMLYALSGAPREAFERFGLPRNTPVFNPTFRGERVVRSPDIMRDPRYGRLAPHHGMPKGHLPVRSYLAVPVISRSGEVIGGLFFGHPEPGVFTERHERIIVGIAAQAAVAIDNARLYEVAQRAAEERMKLLESERASRTEAERMTRMKDEFLVTLSHELRTPLQAILGWAQILRQPHIKENNLEKGMEAIERNARQQTRLIEDLLDMSRITAGKVHLEIQALDPLRVIEAALEAVRPAAEAKGVRIEKAYDGNGRPISGDANRLQQIMWNLLSNAIKFTPAGGTVRVAMTRTDAHVEIGVADTGIGIAPEFLPHVFERFRQAEASTTRRFGGLGLGLAIVKQLVELHGGTIRAESGGEGKGTTFTVSLPATRAPAASAGAPAQQAVSAAPADFRRSDLRGIRVLVLDDEMDARELIARVLASCAAEVFTAASAEEALALAVRERLDLVLSDIAMPDVDGFEFLRRLRALGERLDTPAIAMTAFARPEDRERALKAGFLMHLAKPIEPADLVATVARVAGRS